MTRGARILTHCNAGALATGGYGTALGVVRSAYAADPTISVIVDETRPLLQGSRLTAWELAQEGIPYTLISDNMAAMLMGEGRVTHVVVGADRIAANGDVVNKIGTYGVAILAREHGIPFIVAAPTSTLDLSMGSADDIPVEERAADGPAAVLRVHAAVAAVELLVVDACDADCGCGDAGWVSGQALNGWNAADLHQAPAPTARAASRFSSTPA
jgi:methylthioribose-1-phosphate isomerase